MQHLEHILEMNELELIDSRAVIYIYIYDDDVCVYIYIYTHSIHKYIYI